MAQPDSSLVRGGALRAAEQQSAQQWHNLTAPHAAAEAVCVGYSREQSYVRSSRIPRRFSASMSVDASLHEHEQAAADAVAAGFGGCDST